LSRLKGIFAKLKIPENNPVFSAALAALFYVVIAMLYIMLSGKIAASFSGSLEQLQQIEAIKGILFVLVTGLLFFVVSLGWWKTTMNQRNMLVESERRALASMYSASLAHDLNNMLMGLMALVQELNDQKEQSEKLVKMRLSLEKMVTRLTDFSRRISTTAKHLQNNEDSWVSLPEALKEIAAFVSKHPDAKHCSIRILDVPDKTLLLNNAYFEQAIANLILNAAQAIDLEGEIEIRSTLKDNGIIIEVHDSGCGIKPEHLDSIFSTGFSSKDKGSGLGLLSVQAFAASCKGDIKVESSPLGGAAFKLRIPLQAEQQPELSMGKVAEKQLEANQ
jgi:signal transduction histidine kinase